MLEFLTGVSRYHVQISCWSASILYQEILLQTVNLSIFIKQTLAEYALIVNFEHISHFFLVFLLLVLNRQTPIQNQQQKHWKRCEMRSKLYKQHFYTQNQAEVGKKLSKSLATLWSWTFDKNVQTNKCGCLNETFEKLKLQWKWKW